MDISTAADNAANYIEIYGHDKFTIGRCGQAACIWGAIAWGNGQTWVDKKSPVITAINEFLGKKSTIPLNNVIMWNNAPERTQEEVVEVLRNVATKYRSDEMRQNG